MNDEHVKNLRDRLTGLTVAENSRPLRPDEPARETPTAGEVADVVAALDYLATRAEMAEALLRSHVEADSGDPEGDDPEDEETPEDAAREQRERALQIGGYVLTRMGVRG